MACYIASNNNRYYAAREATYGQIAPISPQHRFAAKKLGIREQVETGRRRDKTGTRTYQGVPGALRRITTFEVESYLTGRASGAEAPQHAALLESALGAGMRPSGGGVATINGNLVTFQSGHGITEGMGLTAGGELRMVSGVVDSQTIVLNAPFTTWMGTSTVGGTVTFGLSDQLPSVTLYDYWSPDTAVQRMLRGAVVNEMQIVVNGDFHEFTFAGPAAELLDSTTQGASFPEEPLMAESNDMPVLGHLGQMWIGLNPAQIHTVTSAVLKVRNNIESRTREYGSLFPRCMVPGEREVLAEFELYSQDQTAYAELYQAARWRQPVSLFLQLGDQEGQMCGVWMKSFIPETPEFLDTETRLRWKFAASRAQGGSNDELWVSFG